MKASPPLCVATLLAYHYKEQYMFAHYYKEQHMLIDIMPNNLQHDPCNTLEFPAF
jgi:hypothetical protein